MKKIILLAIISVAVLYLHAERVISLEEARDLLLRNNPQYLAKEAALNTAEWEMRASLSSLFPSARLQGGYNYLDPKPFIGAAEHYSLSYGVNVTQPIFMGGKLWLSYRMSRDAVEIARADLENTRLSLFSELEEAYFNYLLTGELYEINLRALVIAEQNLDIARRRMEAGTLSRADFLQLQAELSTREVSLLQAENSRQLSFRQLQIMLKIDDFDVLPIDFDLYEDLFYIYQNLEGEVRDEIRKKLVLYGMVNNPLLIMSRTGKRISDKALKISLGNFLPALNLSATRSWNDNFSGERDFEASTTFLISASIPIFPIIDNYSSYRSSYHRHRQTERDVETAEDNIRLAIEAAYFSGITSARTIVSAELAYQYAEETYNMMEERFRNGLISSLELISIELLLTTSSLNATTSKYDFLKNRSALMNLLNIDNDRQLLEIMAGD